MNLQVADLSNVSGSFEERGYVVVPGLVDAALLQPGDALLYRGHDCFHWRDAYAGQQLAQVFLHYVDRNGPHAAEKFDGRESLMRPPAPTRATVNDAEIEPTGIGHRQFRPGTATINCNL
jgi:hypothetical protein